MPSGDHAVTLDYERGRVPDAPHGRVAVSVHRPFLPGACKPYNSRPGVERAGSAAVPFLLILSSWVGLDGRQGRRRGVGVGEGAMTLRERDLSELPADIAAVGARVLAADDVYRVIGEQLADLVEDAQFA